jgi:uncharacterized protein (DUF2236 family)
MSLFTPARTLLEKIVTSRTEPCGVPGVNYLEPLGDPGIFGPASVTWRVLSNPSSVLIGGITAVLLELAEPRVRSGAALSSLIETGTQTGLCNLALPPELETK